MSSVPKQFLELNGRPVLLHTLEAFCRYSDALEIILVLPEDEITTWTELSRKHGFNRTLVVQAGGNSRFQSVKKGLENIQGDGLVAIHDGVRPLISPELIAASFRYAAQHQSAICAVPLKESLRKIDDASFKKDPTQWQEHTRAVERAAFRLIQTPQTFRLALIKEAYRTPERADATDDATVFERAGNKVFLIPGSYNNIKITTPEDLVIAEALMRSQQL